MTTFRTTKGRAVPHCHVGGPPPCDELHVVTDGEVEEASAWLARNFPGVIEVRPGTCDYNCFGRAFARSHGWFEIAETFLDDDHMQELLSAPIVGDIVIYKIGSEITHAAVVTRVENGRITQLISKWGGMPEVLHALREVPPSHGRPVELYRRLPGGVHFSTEADENEGAAMSKDEFSRALQQFASSDIHFTLMLASTKKVRERIIASLPEVQLLLEKRPEANDEVLAFFQREETQNNADASGITLYLLQHMPSEAAARAVAYHIAEGKVSAVNRQLAAQAFLASTPVQPDDEEDIVEVATREARAFLGIE